jgi:protoporphyrinogen oxidase
MENEREVIIIGAGISGLIAAIELEKQGVQPVIYEASDRVGGRVKTDKLDGFKLDHGFQVLLTAYPEAQKYLDYEALDLKTFSPGALIYDGNQPFALSDPLRQPGTLASMIFSRVGTIGDKIKMWSLSRMLKKKSIEEIFESEETTTMQYLNNYGFSEKVITHFFKPFFSGIFLETELATSSRMFEFVFKMFSEGNAAVPANGMQEIPNQLAAQLKNTRIHFNKEVSRIEGQTIAFVNGDMVEAEKIIIAADPYNILPGLSSQTQDYHSVINLYFSVDRSVIQKPLIGLVSKNGALINNFNYMTDVSTDYAPEGQCLLSISVVKEISLKQEELVRAIKKEFSELTGQDTGSMQFLKMYHIKKALPILEDIQAEIQPTATRIQNKVFLAGDYLLNGSLNAAMASGRAAALAALK